MNWPRAILTDFGGYQVMSLAKLRTHRRERRHLPLASRRRAHHLTPERSIEIQHLLGADITMAFDECTPFPATRGRGARARWSCRCAGPSARKAAFAARRGQARSSASCRAASIRRCASESAARARPTIGFDGYAVGGLAVGEGQEHDVRGARRDGAGAARAMRRAISWASASPTTWSARCCAASTCSIACCRRARAARRRPSRGAARSICATRATATIRARSTTTAPAPPASNIRAPISIISCAPTRSSAACF